MDEVLGGVDGVGHRLDRAEVAPRSARRELPPTIGRRAQRCGSSVTIEGSQSGHCVAVADQIKPSVRARMA